MDAHDERNAYSNPKLFLKRLILLKSPELFAPDVGASLRGQGLGRRSGRQREQPGTPGTRRFECIHSAEATSH